MSFAGLKGEAGNDAALLLLWSRNELLMNDSRIDEALKVGFEREKQIERLKAVPQISEDYIDGQYSYLYAKLAYIYCMEKKYEKAEQYYQKYLSKKESHTPDGKMYSVPYLALSGQYEKVIDNCRGSRN